MSLDRYGNAISKWIRYDDGLLEPVRQGQNLNDKQRGSGIPDWWVIDMPADFDPKSKGLDVVGNHPSGPQATKQKQAMELADVTINTFNGAYGFGHLGMDVDGDFIGSHGKYPKNGGAFGVPSAIKADDINKLTGSITIPTTPQQDLILRGYVEDGRNGKNLDSYTITKENCTDWVNGGLKKAGVKTPDDPSIAPYRYLDQLKKVHGL